MPHSYVCDNCGATATSLSGWTLVGAHFMHDDESSTVPPYGRTVYYIAPHLLFHSPECAAAWCTKAAVAPPPAP